MKKRKEGRKRELIFRMTRKDFIVQAKTGHGKGGQNRNRRRTACRIFHEASGAEGNAQDERSYPQNERLAFKRLVVTKKFKHWHSMETSRRLGHLENIEDRVEKMMDPKNLRVEVKENGKWVRENVQRRHT